jgi:hypothetical protein
MTKMSDLSPTDSVTGGDSFPFTPSNGGADKRASLTIIADWLQDNLDLPGLQVTQYSAPSATGFSVALTAPDTWLLLTPTGTLAAGTVTLPSAPNDRSTVTVSSTQAVTSLTVSASATLNGAPTTIAANGYFSMRYDGVLKGWYRVG